jgi:hypothetical protein
MEEMMRLTGSFALAATLLAVGAGPAAAQGKPGSAEGDHYRFARRVPFAATLMTTLQTVFPGADGYNDACAGSPMHTLVGAGTSELFGLVWVRQSHCIGASEATPEGVTTIPITGGTFELVDTKGKTILGQYRGRLVGTFNAGFHELGPFGHWLIQGQACVSGGTRYAGIVDDCTAGKSAPVRGFANLTTLDATLFLDQTFGVSGRH